MRDGEHGWYVYCVTQADQPPLDIPAGVDPQLGGVEGIAHGGLAALASRVRLSEFGDAALSRNLQDVGWLARTARAHDAVIAHVMSAAAVVPMRLCTIFTDRQHVAAMLQREQGRLLEQLARVRGHAEWSVKMLTEPATVEAVVRDAAQASGDAETSAPGRAYLARKSRQRGLEEAVQGMEDEVAEAVHGRLRELAVACTVLPVQRAEVSGRPGRMVLNGAYLVERAREDAFAATARELGEAHRLSGIELELTGPWAPYNFVTLTESGE